MDRILTGFSGRPSSIQESRCTDPLIRAPTFHNSITPNQAHEVDLLSIAIQSVKILGVIEDKLYHRSIVSTEVAINIAMDLDSWVQSLPVSLQMCSSSTSSVAQLNIWLLHCFNVIQLTRPFLIAHTRNIHTPPGSSLESRGEYAETKKLAEACIRAASQTITTIQAASAKDLISAKNPFTV